MDVLPAIDIRSGKVVRLSQGDYDQQTVYADDPVEIAKTFADAGARWIHVVDLDAARTGELTALDSLSAIVKQVDINIEFGGGVRDTKTVERLLQAGAARLVIGSAALKNWSWFESLSNRSDLSGKLALGLDARHGKLAVQGWTEQIEATPVEIAKRVAGWPLGAIVYTDISRDGMLTGTNLEATAEVIAATDVPVVASGGVASLDDVRGALRVGCSGVIIGKAWYEGKVDLQEAVRIAQ